MTLALPFDRPALVRRSRRLNYATLAYNSLEGVLALGAGLFAGSIALVGFGVDSLIELTASATALWRLRADVDPVHRERAEYRSLRGHRAVVPGAVCRDRRGPDADLRQGARAEIGWELRSHLSRSW
jgi:hypothetical protein